MNRIPPSDGSVTLYGPASCQRRVIYINGINTSAKEHQDKAMVLSGILNTQVIGVYNASDGVRQDLRESSQEYADLVTDVLAIDGKKVSSEVLRVGSKILSYALPLPGLEHLGAAGAAKLDSMRVRPFTDYMTNPATFAMWSVLAHATAQWPHVAVSIVAHSQGNLIASSALFMNEYSRATRGVGTARQIHVYALASPSPVWPDSAQLSVRTYAYADDIVPWLSLGRSFGGAVGIAGNPAHAHDFSGYVHESLFYRDLAFDLGIVGVDDPAKALAQSA